MGELGARFLNSWPPFSSDLYLIEYLWQLMKTWLQKNRSDATLPHGSPGYQTLRRNLRTSNLDPIADCPETFDTMYIFTEFESDKDHGRSVLAEYQAAAQRRGGFSCR
jgi:hypothetical protein